MKPPRSKPKPTKNEDIGASFEEKENNSLNYDEFSPSRIVEAHVKHFGKNSGFLDSNSSLSSPKDENGQKKFVLDKSSFLKNLSPERDSAKKPQTNSHQITLDVNMSQLQQNVSERERARHPKALKHL